MRLLDEACSTQAFEDDAQPSSCAQGRPAYRYLFEHGTLGKLTHEDDHTICAGALCTAPSPSFAEDKPGTRSTHPGIAPPR